MASRVVIIGGGEEEVEEVISPGSGRKRTVISRSNSTSTSTSPSCQLVGPFCLCAPATHAGSFKCRLHRSNSTGQSPTATSPTSGQFKT